MIYDSIEYILTNVIKIIKSVNFVMKKVKSSKI